MRDRAIAGCRRGAKMKCFSMSTCSRVAATRGRVSGLPFIMQGFFGKIVVAPSSAVAVALHEIGRLCAYVRGLPLKCKNDPTGNGRNLLLPREISQCKYDCGSPIYVQFTG